MLVWEFFENPELKCLLPEYDFYLAEVIDYADYYNKEAFFYNSRGIDYDGDIRLYKHTFHYQSNPDKTGFCYMISEEELGDSAIIKIGSVKDYIDGEVHLGVWVYPPKRCSKDMLHPTISTGRRKCQNGRDNLWSILK